MRLHIAALFGAATALQLAPTSRLVPVAFLPHRRAGRVIAGSDDTEPARIAGKLVNVGDRLLCRDEESNAWWSAAIRDIRGSELLITFMGCDNAWDTWMDASSPDLSLMDAVDIKKEESAFQSGERERTTATADHSALCPFPSSTKYLRMHPASLCAAHWPCADTYEDTLTDEEMIEEYRKQRWDDNARWQLTTFAQAQMGQWGGTAEIYEASAEDAQRVKKLVGPWVPDCESEAKVSGSQEVQLSEKLPAPAEPLALSLNVIGADGFRPECGNMAVGGAFTLASPSKAADGASDGGWLIEMCLREESRRVRCKLLYRPADGDSAAEVPAMRLANVAIVREVLGGGEFVTSDVSGEEPDIDGSPGRGLYDPPPGEKLRYVSLYSEGGITLVFPSEVSADSEGVISLDWIAGRMRYQIDRKFAKMDGSLSSLELTEIQKADAETYLPDFPHQGGGGDGGGFYGGHSYGVNKKK